MCPFDDLGVWLVTNRKQDDAEALQYEIAGRLLLLRVRLFKNASAMARSVNLTPQAWYNFETGRRSLDASVALKIVEACGVDFNWIFAGRSIKVSRKARALIINALGPPAKPARRKQRSTKSAARSG